MKERWRIEVDEETTMEKRLILQSFILCLVLCASVYAFNFGDAVKNFLSISDQGQYYIYYIEYLLGDVVFGINPLLYIALNE